MRILLDSHAFLWYISSDSKLSPAAEKVITESQEVFVSVATLWELSLKHANGKLTLAAPPKEFFEVHLDRNQFRTLEIRASHVFEATTMQSHGAHKDPFDRLLAAQAITESLSIVSIDSQLDQYGLIRIW